MMYNLKVLTMIQNQSLGNYDGKVVTGVSVDFKRNVVTPTFSDKTKNRQPPAPHLAFPQGA
jgi:hypothetical protein